MAVGHTSGRFRANDQFLWAVGYAKAMGPMGPKQGPACWAVWQRNVGH